VHVKWTLIDEGQRFTIRHTDDLETVAEIAEQCFTEREREPKATLEVTDHWLAYDEDGDAVAFAGARLFMEDGELHAYLCASGVLPHARGAGLQKRLTRARMRWALRHGAAAVYTYISNGNPASGNSLIACGFRMYWPETPWAGPEFVYLRCDLNPAHPEPHGAIH
jgi:GNAT superfamily N-acetyltransferase